MNLIFNLAGRSAILGQRCFANVKAPLTLSKRFKVELRNIEARRQARAKKMGYSLLVIPITAFGLGVWQIQRYFWKIDLIETLNFKTTQAPLPLPENYMELDDMEYCKVKVIGNFDYSNEVYILPRANVHTLDSRNPASGAYVVTPFRLENNDVILVNRGWVPRNKTDPKTRPSGQIEDKVELTGIIRKTERKLNYVSKKVSNEVWHVRDIEGIAQTLGTLPIFIDADEASTVEGGPIGGQTRIAIRNDHPQYIITWFSLSVATFYMWFRMFAK